MSSAALYGGTVNQFKHLLRKLAVELTWVDPDDLDAWKAAVRSNTKAFFGETIGNPGGNVLDIEAIAAIAHEHGVPLLVDNTFATPYLCRPIEWGADIVLHSATKFIGGHGTSIGGVVVDSGQFNWSNGRFPVIAEPSPAYHGLQFHETFGMYGYLMKLRAETLRDLGACMSPFNAFLFLQGLETLSLRMARHVENALAVASYLESHELASQRRPTRACARSRYRPLADKYLPRGAGAVFSFDIRGRPRGRSRSSFAALTLWSHLANVGDAKSLVIHPASTTHRQLRRAGAARRRRRPGDHPPLRRHRRCRRSDLGPGAGLCPRSRVALGGARAMTAFDLARYQDPLTIQRVLLSAKTIAIVGLSSNALRASYFVGFYLQRHGYRVIPVNPRESEILGERCYRKPARRAGRRGHRQRIPRPGRTAGHRRTRRSPSARSACGASSGDQRGRRADRRERRPHGRHGSVHQGRARPLRGANALARLQYRADHLGARRAAVAFCGFRSCEPDRAALAARMPQACGNAEPARSETKGGKSSPSRAERPRPRTGPVYNSAYIPFLKVTSMDRRNMILGTVAAAMAAASTRLLAQGAAGANSSQALNALFDQFMKEVWLSPTLVVGLGP